jgi:hypothetical protein
LARKTLFHNLSDLFSTGMLEALRKQNEYYGSLGLDMSSDAISLPGLAAKYLYSTMPEQSFFTLYKTNPGIYDRIRSNIRGGVSLIFHRYHEAGVTKIRPEEFGENALTCQSCIGVDVSGMYLSIMMQDQCTG